MKKNMKWMAIAGMVAITTGFANCNEEYVDLEYKGNLDLNQLLLVQASEIWNGAECNVQLPSLQYDAEKPAADKVFPLNLGMYQNRAAAQTATADLIVDKDSLQAAIAKADEGGVYAVYAGAQLMPADCYALSASQLTLASGATRSEDATLTIYLSKLIDYVQQVAQANTTFVLPVSITNASTFALNEKTHTLMYFVTVDYKGKEYDADGEGVPDDHTLEGGYRLLWHDEFNGSGAPNENMWRFEEGFQRNEEDQWYSKNNAVQQGNALVITAKKERVKNPNYNPNATGGNSWKQTREYAEYTSACIVAKGEYAFKYGRLEVRAKIPVSQGCWPAIWSTGNWYEWPLGGEIDILEFYKEKIHANLCWGGDSRWNGTWNSKNYSITNFTGKDPAWADKYHVWRMDWDEKFIRIYLDDELLNETNLSTTKNKGAHGASGGGDINPFSNDLVGFGQCMMLNLAIGGINGRPIEATFPQEYRVDYVRVYQK